MALSWMIREIQVFFRSAEVLRIEALQLHTWASHCYVLYNH